MYNRTGTELLIVAWRSDFSQYTQPRSFVTSEGIENFMQLTCKMDVETFAKRGECYLLSGIEGACFTKRSFKVLTCSSGHKNSYYRELIALKSSVATLLLDLIREYPLPYVSATNRSVLLYF